MTALLWFLAGAACMGLVVWLRRGNARAKLILRTVELTKLEHGWHEPGGVPIVPAPRRRSPNEQFVTRIHAESRSMLAEQSRADRAS